MIGNYWETTPEEKALWQEQQRVAMIENYRQSIALQCAVAMSIKLADEQIPSVDVARRAKRIADALCREMFGE